MKKIECKNCKGKGHVLDAVTLLWPVFWFLAPFEKNNKNGVTREICYHCGGTGYVKIDNK
jgi:DnaJ-class molecular chaperone